MGSSFTVEEAKRKLERYCAYQERCHEEVVKRLRELRMIDEAIDVIVVHLIENNFLNEERFACSFARGRHRIKSWGRNRISSELKSRNISAYNINKALKEIAEEYDETFERVSRHHWESLRETDLIKRRRKFCDFLLRKGFESDLIYEKVRSLEKESGT